MRTYSCGKTKPCFTIARGKAWENISVPNSIGPEAQLLYFGSLAQVSEKNRSSLKTLLDKKPKYVLVDLNLRDGCYTNQTIEDCLYYATMLKVNENEWDLVSEMCTELGLRKCGECDRLYGNVGKLEDDARTSVGMKCGRCAYVAG